MNNLDLSFWTCIPLLEGGFFLFTQWHVFIALRETGKEREKHQHERENLNWLLPICAQTRDPLCPDRESNQQPFGWGMMLQPTEPHQPGTLLVWTSLFILHSYRSIFLKNHHPRICLLTWEREREKYPCERKIDRLLSLCTLTGDRTCSLFGVWHDALTNWVTWPGLHDFYLIMMFC